MHNWNRPNVYWWWIMNKKTLIFGLISALFIILIIYTVYASCCTKFCFDVDLPDCPSGMFSTNECKDIESCMLGCCIDENGFQHNKYPKGECLRKGGNFLNKCTDLSTCETSKPSKI